MSKVVSGTAEAFVWDTAEGLPLLLQDGGTRYIMGPDGLPLESVNGSGTVLYYLHDQLGSTRGLLDGSGTGVASYSYTPYGTVSLHTGAVTGFLCHGYGAPSAEGCFRVGQLASVDAGANQRS